MTDYEALAEEAKGSFDLGGLLKGQPNLAKTKKVTLYLDQDAGEAVGGFDIETDALGRETKTRWGLVGEIDTAVEQVNLINAVLGEDDEKIEEAGIDSETAQTYISKRDELYAEIKRLQDVLKPLHEQLEASALDLEIHYLPPIITKSAREAARKHLGLKKVDPGTPEFSDYIAEFNAQILSRACKSITQRSTGQTNASLSVEEAREMYEYLPTSEQNRLDAAVNEIVFKAKIAQNIALDAGF